MPKRITGESTAVQMMLAAKAKLLAVHTGLTNYGERAKMDMKQVERVETSLSHLERAIQAVAASSDMHEDEGEHLPF